MAELDELYQSIILDHNRRPRNFRAMDDAERRTEGRNPLCGDEFTLWLKLDGDKVADISFKGQGCAISKASGLAHDGGREGQDGAKAEQSVRAISIGVVTGRLPDGERETMGSLAALGGVSRFPLRVKCASLAWHALKSALEQGPAEVDDSNRPQRRMTTHPRRQSRHHAALAPLAPRADFPLLAGDPGAALPRLRGHVAEAARRARRDRRQYYESDNANPHRGAYALSARATERYHDARETRRAFPRRGRSPTR